MISIIVPVYKVEKYLNRCIESIVNQSYKDLEIILIDDGSPDNCPHICDQWAEKDQRIIVIHKENAGPSAARNAGLDIAKGEYFYFVDSDDYIESDLCARVLACFDKNDVSIVTFDAHIVDEEGHLLGSTEDVRDGVISCDEALLLLMRGRINNYAWNKMYKRQVFDNIRFPVGRLWEDVAISYKLLLESKHIYCTSEKFYYYVQRSDSIIHAMNGKALKDIFLARYEIYYALKENYPEAAEEAFSLAILSARRLYDRSLWEKVDADVLKQSMQFLADNKAHILKTHRSFKYVLLLRCPKIYKVLRLIKHACGNAMKYFRK